jgi:hypothetical protein
VTLLQSTFEEIIMSRRFHHRAGFVLGLLVALLPLAGLVEARAQAVPTPLEEKTPVPPKPANHAGPRKFESTITAIDKAANPPTVTLRSGAVMVALKPTVALVQEERDVVAADLKVGDAISLITLKIAGEDPKIEEASSVTGLNPLTVMIGDFASLTLTKVEVASFSRITPLPVTDLRPGQTVAVLMDVRADGEIDIKRLAVIVAKPRPPRPRKATKPTKLRTPKTPKSRPQAPHRKHRRLWLPPDKTPVPKIDPFGSTKMA